MPQRVPPGAHFRVRIVLEHAEPVTLGEMNGPARLSYRWNADEREPLRTPFPRPLAPNVQAVADIAVRAPDLPGTYAFTPAIVIEGERWILGTPASAAIDVRVGALHPDDDFERYEGRVFSQNGEDGLIRELLFRIGAPARFIIEIGAGDGSENNSTRLIEEAGFGACVVEGDPGNAAVLAERHARRAGVTVLSAFVDAESIAALLVNARVPAEPDVLSIDVDGNDAAIWERACTVVRPRVVVIEYNAQRGPDADWVMPYDAQHRWTGDAEFGASLAALERYGKKLGYGLIGTNRSGINAFFVRDDLLPAARFPVRSARDAYHALGGYLSPIVAAANSAELRATYTRDYYVGNCGGFAEFGGTDPLSIGDPRLRVTATFAEIRGGRRALDLGCGRGEVAAYLAARGWTVDAVDYSADAIALAREHAERTGIEPSAIRFVQSDVGSFVFERDAYDLVIASDVIEHLAHNELDTLYANVRTALAPAGLFVVHTFPNAWHYAYDYPRRRKAAAARGEIWPADPRTEFERLMHINEQSPRTLQRQLRAAFPFVELWAGSPLDPFASPLAQSTRAALREAPDLFAVAAIGPITDVAASSVFMQHPLSAEARGALSVSLAGQIERYDDGGAGVWVEIVNATANVLSSAGSKPVMLAYHWLDRDRNVVVFDGRRTPLGPPLRPGERATRRMLLDPPPSDDAVARITLVQEGVAWFDDAGVYVDVQPGLRANAV